MTQNMFFVSCQMVIWRIKYKQSNPQRHVMIPIYEVKYIVLIEGVI